MGDMNFAADIYRPYIICPHCGIEIDNRTCHKKITQSKQNINCIKCQQDIVVEKRIEISYRGFKPILDAPVYDYEKL